MRRIQRAPLAIFNIAFLDIISCAFGAVVMLVLLAKNGETDNERGPDNLSTLIEQVLQARQQEADLTDALSGKRDELAAAKKQSASVTGQQQNLDASILRAQQTLEQLNNKAASLRQDIRAATALLARAASRPKPEENIGGIPTDADYVVFVIDNSGSMSGRGWGRVINVVNDILKNHPKMKGFQIMAADGNYMFSSKAGQWLQDQGTMRQTAMSAMSSFKGGGSEPEKGIINAIDTYKGTQGSVSLYVFGDDYRLANLDNIVRLITDKNRGADGKPVIRIHGIGFSRHNGNAERFAAFMQAVAKRNRGAFVGLNF